VTTTKPFGAKWFPSDFAGYELQINGRRGADPVTTNKIIGRIAISKIDFSLLTQRVTILVPANETWEIKTVKMEFTPQIATGIDPFVVPLRKFPSSHFPPPGQVLAIDFDVKTGTVMMGPVSVVIIPAPGSVPDNIPGDCSPPLPQLKLLGSIWKVADGKVMRDSVALLANAYADLNQICVDGNKAIRGISPTHGYETFNPATNAWQ